MTEKASYRKGYLTADFLSQNYRISGEMSLRAGAVADVINDKMSEFIRLENVYVSPITEPATLKGHYQVGQTYKSTLTMVVISREEDAYPRRVALTPPAGPAPFRVFITVPGFEILGGLKVDSVVDIDRLLIHGSERFVPIYQATATVTTNPSVRFTGGGILVNREHFGIFCVEKNPEV